MCGQHNDITGGQDGRKTITPTRIIENPAWTPLSYQLKSILLQRLNIIILWRSKSKENWQFSRAESGAKQQTKTTTSLWNELIKALKNKYNSADRNNERKRDSENQLHTQDETGGSALKQYIKKATCINDDLAEK